MLSLEIRKVINLIQKSYSQPLILQRLYLHLRDICGTSFTPLDNFSSWDKLIIYGAVDNKLPNQALEMKLLKFLKELKDIKLSQSVELNIMKLKLTIICYYMINRPIELTNHIVMFNLVSNYMGIDDYFDGLIIKIVKRTVLANVFNLKMNKKLTNDSLTRMIEILSNKELSTANSTQILPCFINYNLKEYKMIENIPISNDFLCIKFIENLFLYMKYAHDPTIVVNEIKLVESLILPLMKSLMSFNLGIEFNNVKYSEFIKDKTIFKLIKESFDMENDKEIFVNEVTEYLTKLYSEFNKN
ncbi:hypothetical protein HERIO_951 [Hepatospora eriocheir]|uniref:Uncharacterized protein n=1 Tax=Hepatospora eriocheir TaxID=1081669 RepID=A0A1X0QBV1_9MICR|nr:hypothetical protein HERIO_951 [Hepatospora eriocheir]